MYIKRKIEPRSRNQFYRGKVICIANSERVASLSYPANKAHGTYLHYIVICGLSGFPTFLHITL
jgi:hypothetical protein